MSSPNWDDKLLDMMLEEQLGGDQPPDVLPAVLDRIRHHGRILLYALAGGATAAAAGLLLILHMWSNPPARPNNIHATGHYEVVEGRPVERGVTLKTAAKTAGLTLDDYVTVDIRPHTTVAIKGKPGSEHIMLQAGETVCSVEPDVGSFVVETEIGSVRVLGTQFSVRLTDAKEGDSMNTKRMLVSVATGAVLVSGSWGSQTVNAGEELTTSASGPTRSTASLQERKQMMEALAKEELDRMKHDAPAHTLASAWRLFKIGHIRSAIRQCMGVAQLFPDSPSAAHAELWIEHMKTNPYLTHLPRIAWLKYPGRGWGDGLKSNADVNLLKVFQRDTALNVAPNAFVLPLAELGRYPRSLAPELLYMTGDSTITATQEQTDALRSALDQGVTLLADAGGPQWDREFRSFITNVFPESELEVIPKDDPLFSPPGYRTIKPPALWSHGGENMMGIRTDNRWVVIYHPGDLGDAWEEGHSGLDGRIAGLAYDLGTACLLHALEFGFGGRDHAPAPKRVSEQVDTLLEGKNVEAARDLLRASYIDHYGSYTHSYSSSLLCKWIVAEQRLNGRHSPEALQLLHMVLERDPTALGWGRVAAKYFDSDFEKIRPAEVRRNTAQMFRDRAAVLLKKARAVQDGAQAARAERVMRNALLLETSDPLMPKTAAVLLRLPIGFSQRLMQLVTSEAISARPQQRTPSRSAGKKTSADDPANMDFAKLRPVPGSDTPKHGVPPRSSGWVALNRWYFSQPYSNPTNNPKARFAPEIGKGGGPYVLIADLPIAGKGPDDTPAWQEQITTNGAWVVVPPEPTDHTVWYAYTEVYSPMDQELRCLFSADDYGKVWINGKLVFAKTTHPRLGSSLTPYTVKFHRGYNPIFTKLENTWGRTGLSLLIEVKR